MTLNNKVKIEDQNSVGPPPKKTYSSSISRKISIRLLQNGKLRNIGTIKSDIVENLVTS